MLFNKLLNNNVYHLGDLNVFAHIANITSSPESQDNPLCYLCGGDPSLELWTETPHNMRVLWTFSNNYLHVLTYTYGGFFVTYAAENGERIDSIACNNTLFSLTLPANQNKFYVTFNKHNYYPYVIYYDSVSEYISGTVFDYDAYYSATPVDIFSINPTDKVTVKKNHKLIIKNGSEGVEIMENFEVEKGAVFEIQ